MVSSFRAGASAKVPGPEKGRLGVREQKRSKRISRPWQLGRVQGGIKDKSSAWKASNTKNGPINRKGWLG